MPGRRPNVQIVSECDDAGCGYPIADETSVPETPFAHVGWIHFLDSPAHELTGKLWPADHGESVGITSISKLRKLFWNWDTDSSGGISEAELLAQVQASLREDTWTSSSNIVDLLKETVRRRFVQIDLRRDGTIDLDEWIHFMMLRLTAPSHVAARHLNKALSDVIHGKMRTDPYLLSRLHSAFDQADVAGDGLIAPEQWTIAFEQEGFPLPSEVDLNNDGILTYFEFVSHAIGVTLEQVHLALYDLSSGFVQYIPSTLLLGHSYEGVWHAAVRVFGKEFWYGGEIFASENCKVPARFGKPVKIIALGKTMRGEAELMEFMLHDLCPTYNRANYHVLNHNCVCFANEVVKFLLHGKKVPEEVRKQPKWVTNSVLYPIIEPILKKLFDSIEDHGSFHREVDDMTDEWRKRVRAGDLVLYRKCFISAPQVAKVLGISRVADRRCADLLFFQPVSATCSDEASPKKGTPVPRSVSESSGSSPWVWKLVQRQQVPVSRLYPCYKDAHVDHLTLQIAPDMDSEVCDVLKRYPSKHFKAICEEGHELNMISLSWLSGTPTCSICGVDRASVGHDGQPARMCCTKCDFDVCGRCLDRGLTMQGGGVFADILTPPLAMELLSNFGWLNWRARRFFVLAKKGDESVLDQDSITRAIRRLKAELGLFDVSFTRNMHEFLTTHYGSARPSGITSKAFKTIYCHILAAADKTNVPFADNTKTTNVDFSSTYDLTESHDFDEAIMGTSSDEADMASIDAISSFMTSMDPTVFAKCAPPHQSPKKKANQRLI